MHAAAAPGAPYRFGFLLNTTLGNMTRYVNLRKYAERDPEVVFTWAPVSHWTAPDHPTRWRFLPEPLFMRARVLEQSMPVLRHLGALDAVMIHLFEADLLLALRSLVAPRPLRFSSTDEAPITNRATYPLYPKELAKPVWRQKLRLALDLWRVRHTDYFVPFSQWVADILVGDCHAPPDRVGAQHVGVDLEQWPLIEPRPLVAGERCRILFVGGDFVRKGGRLLLDVFQQRFADRCELHLVTRQAPADLPPHVRVYPDFHPNDPRLAALYSEMDLLAVPTDADVGPLWVYMEAMAKGLPLVGTDVGSARELVRPDETGFLIPKGDGAALAAAIQALVDDPALRRRLGRNGRAYVEQRYDAAKNVPRILQTMKTAVDRDRAARRGSATRAAPDATSGSASESASASGPGSASASER